MINLLLNHLKAKQYSTFLRTKIWIIVLSDIKNSETPQKSSKVKSVKQLSHVILDIVLIISLKSIYIKSVLQILLEFIKNVTQMMSILVFSTVFY